MTSNSRKCPDSGRAHNLGHSTSSPCPTATVNSRPPISPVVESTCSGRLWAVRLFGSPHTSVLPPRVVTK